MSNETKLAAAIVRLVSLQHLGEIKTRINPDISGGEKSTEIFLEIENFSFGAEIVNSPDEKILYWVDGQDATEETWASVLDDLENDKYFLNKGF